jgi:methylmalonyl-CoA mutase N-terminal domain/subunit
MEEDANAYIRRIDEMGGMLRAVEAGYPQREIARSAYELERQVNAGDRVVVGLNRYARDEPDRIPTLRIDESVETSQVENLRRVKADRSQARVDEALAGVRRAAESSDNLVPPIVLAAKAHATEQEICDVLRAVFGEYHDRGEF